MPSHTASSTDLTEPGSTVETGGVTYVPAAAGRNYWVPEEPPKDLVDDEGPPMSRYTFLGLGETTHGELTVIDTEVPAGNGPPEHHHRDADESFYGLAGEFWFQAGDAQFILRPGDFAFVRRGTPHVWKNLTDETCRMLRIYTPAGHEQFFFDIGRPAAAGEEPPRLTSADALRAEAVAEMYYGAASEVAP